MKHSDSVLAGMIVACLLISMIRRPEDIPYFLVSGVAGWVVGGIIKKWGR